MTEDDIDDAIDRIYSTIDAMMRAGQFAEVDATLQTVDPTVLPVVISLAYLSITTPARDLLHCRAPLAARVRAHLKATRPVECEDLLRGLE